MRIAYHEELSINDPWISLNKPRKVFNCVYEKTRDILLPVERFGAEDFYRCHDVRWVDRVMAGTDYNGFGDFRPEVIEQVRYAHGAMYTAAKAAIMYGVAFAPVSGFHHAGFDYNGGFCTFNGLMTTICKLRSENRVGSVLVLDFDGHWGDGTQDILDTFGTEGIVHMGRGRPFKSAALAVAEACVALEDKPDLVLYQAGADSMRSDPFGAGYFSREDWLKKDAIIFDTCKNLGIPIAWNLAGGYNGKDTVMAHAGTFYAAVRAFEPYPQFGIPVPSVDPDSLERLVTGHL